MSVADASPSPRHRTPRAGEKLPPERIVVVTGANSGLGFHCVQTLVKQDQVVAILACRNVEAGRAAATEIQTLTGCQSERVVVIDAPLDLADYASVRAYAAALKAWLGQCQNRNARIWALVNNAGIGPGTPGVGPSLEHKKNEHGHDLIFASNHLGHFLLTLLLLPVITTRVVNVTSEVHDPTNGLPLPDPSMFWPTTEALYNTQLAGGEPAVAGEEEGISAGRRFTLSKLCNVFFTYELARRLSGAVPAQLDPEVLTAVRALPGGASCVLPGARAISVVAFNPGLMFDTNFFTAGAGTVAGWLVWACTPLLRLTPIGYFMTTGPASGAILARASLGEVKTSLGPTAAYLDKASEKHSSEFSRSRKGLTNCAVDLWRHSIRWAQITRAELENAGFGSS